jgi:MFS family permease
MSNPRKSALTSLVVSAISLIGIFIPSLVGIDGFDGGFAISAVCFAVFLIAIICAPVFWWISRKEKGLREGEHLAHWTYTDEEWIKFVKMENVMDASFKKTMFLIIMAFAVLCGIGFYIMDPEGGLYVAYAMAGLVVLMGLVALLTTYTAKRRLNKKGEVFISKD